MKTGAILGMLLVVMAGFWFARQRFGLFTQRLEPGEIISQTPEILELVGDESKTVEWEVETVATNLEVPWSLVFTSPSRLLVAERPGRIRQLVNGQLQSGSLIQFSQVSSQDEEGLMGLTIDPDYQGNQYIYACYAYATNEGLRDRVVRLRDEGERLIEDQVIIEDIPAAQFHAGCRLAFGPDKKLYITTGDATDKNIAQDISSLGGKILRLNPDGSIPVDNPFPNSPVWSYGHRNPQGIAWHPETKLMYSSEHGPSTFDGPAGGDEVNQIDPGANYGWPLVSHERNQAGLTAPLITFTPAEAPGSLMMYSGSVFPQYSHNLFFGALRGEGILRLILDESNPDQIATYEKLDISVGRIREVIEGPDGFIYFTTSNRDGRGQVHENDDKLYRLVPKED